MPIVVDVETGGCNPAEDALLELAAVFVTMDEEGLLKPTDTYTHHVQVFEGGHLDPEALAVNHIDPYHPFRFAVPEKEALTGLFKVIDATLEKTGCRRAVLVGHNAHFDLSFIHAAAKRCGLTEKNPFHKFTCFDTATLGGLAFGKTILARAMQAAGIEFDKNYAHSAVYDAEKTAELFCLIVNRWKLL